MPRLYVRRPESAQESADVAHAPEFRYLTSWVEYQARLACEELGWELGQPGGTPKPGDRVLHLTNRRLLVGHRTLAALGRALYAGAPWVAPGSLAALAGEAEVPPVHTVRGFERVETLALDRREGSTEEGPPPLWLADAGAPPPSATDSVHRIGLYHEFIDYYGVPRTDGLAYVPADTERVLEVGCGRGVTGELLQDRLGCRVTGVELNPVVAREATTRLHRVVTGDIERLDPADLLDGGRPFDLVFAFELFEHLAEPEGFLKLARTVLRPGGTILLSTPNVGHYSVVLDLLAGRWDYLPIGLLCYTHLRFFTAHTLDEWLRRLGFDDFDLIPQQTEEAPEIDALERAGLPLDRESLRTSGFFVRIRIPDDTSE